jgi:glycyl-tRNA synthetase beta subunit
VEVSSQVAAILGSTSGITDLKSIADALNSQFSIIESSLAKIGKDLTSNVKDVVSTSSTSLLDPVFNQLTNMAKQIKQIVGERGVSLEKLYQVSSDKKQDMVYLKNKTQELKAAMALNQKMVTNMANKPVTQTWYEYK